MTLFLRALDDCASPHTFFCIATFNLSRKHCYSSMSQIWFLLTLKLIWTRGPFQAEVLLFLECPNRNSEVALTLTVAHCFAASGDHSKANGKLTLRWVVQNLQFVLLLGSLPLAVSIFRRVSDWNTCCIWGLFPVLLLWSMVLAGLSGTSENLTQLCNLLLWLYEKVSLSAL